MQREKVRVYALARELNIESKDLLDICKQAGFDVKNQLSSLEPEQRDQVVDLIKKGGNKASAAAPATPAKPVTPTILDVGGKAVPTLSRPSKPRETERPAAVAEPEPESPAAHAAGVVGASMHPEPTAATPSQEKLPPAAQVTTPAKPADGAAKPADSRPGDARSGDARSGDARPADARPAMPSVPGSRVPTIPTGHREMTDLNRPSTPRTPRRPTPTLGPRPVAPPPLKQFPTKKVEAEPPRQKPIAPIDPKLFKQDKPIRPEDVLPPKTGKEADVVVEDEDEAGKGKKPKGIPGRDRRREARAVRAEKRKAVPGEIEIVSGHVVTADDVEPSKKSHLHRIKRRQNKPTMPRIGKVPLDMPITVRSLSEAVGMRSVELLFKLKDHGGAQLTINSTIEPAMAELIALEAGCEIEIKKPLDAEEQILASLDKTDNPEDLVPRAPIVTIMGHVDHGKTTLLDKIRQSNVAASEIGGITQVIRAWRVQHNGKPITFLDTPGHEAFTKMRARGAVVTDIAVIVVAADDGVMPQTEEAINHAKAAGVSLVVAINKVDLPAANLNRTRQQLYNLNVLPDNMGGDTPFVETSAATGKGIDDLLEQLSIVAELKELKANPSKPGRGTCLEAALSEGEGVRATVLVRDGTLHRGDVLLCGHAYGRIRQMYNDLGQPLEEAGPSVPVRITGLDEVPNADDAFHALPDLSLARQIAEKRKGKLQDSAFAKRPALTLETLTEHKIAELKVILKADFRGSIEAIRKELEKLHHEEVRVRILHAAIGAITESDVQLALTSPEDTMIIGFNVVPDDRALTLAEEKGIQIREYDIIYNLTNDIKSALEGKLKPREEIVHLGRAVVRQTYKISRVGTIAGCYVTQGNIRRNAKVRVIREGVVVYPPADRSAGLESLKRFKEDAGEVREGFECGIKVAGYDDIKVGDVIEAFRVEQVQRSLEDKRS